jgi:hypothetical protein
MNKASAATQASVETLETREFATLETREEFETRESATPALVEAKRECSVAMSEDMDAIVSSEVGSYRVVSKSFHRLSCRDRNRIGMAEVERSL